MQSVVQCLRGSYREDGGIFFTRTHADRSRCNRRNFFPMEILSGYKQKVFTLKQLSIGTGCPEKWRNPPHQKHSRLLNRALHNISLRSLPNYDFSRIDNLKVFLTSVVLIFKLSPFAFCNNPKLTTGLLQSVKIPFLFKKQETDINYYNPVIQLFFLPALFPENSTAKKKNPANTKKPDYRKHGF